MLKCDKCNASITKGSKFCPQCGDPVTEEDKASRILATSSGAPIVQITFGISTSAAFSKAISICENIPTYEVMGEGKQTQYRVTLPLTEVELVANIFDLVGSWKSSQMLINGQVATKKDLSYYGVGCYRNRQKSYQPDAFCYGERQHEANIWGCKKLNMPLYEWGGGWLDYGKFEANGVWKFDKQRIRHELEVTLKEHELCPALNRAKILETLERLPEKINPKTDDNWQYRTNYEEVKGKYKEVAVGIKPVIKKANRYVIGDFKPSWENEEQTNNVIEIPVSIKKEDPVSSKNLPRKKNNTLRFALIILAAIILIAIFK